MANFLPIKTIKNDGTVDTVVMPSMVLKDARARTVTLAVSGTFAAQEEVLVEASLNGDNWLICAFADGSDMEASAPFMTQFNPFNGYIRINSTATNSAVKAELR
ncbi:hypothetical protein AGMMS49573_07930 [Endomicrobiia bacterium]|nr:hypothetical protein AGMMS49573_07930 [Endomicrobiia bacterium]GMO44580.1 MAG: hypothetical protein Ta2F_19100 [Termitinemataceae bacterium]